MFDPAQLPEPIKACLRPVRRWAAQQRLRAAVARAHDLRIVVGASQTRFDGWISSERDALDLADRQSWERYLAPASIDALLAEHVWEHLTPQDAVTGARLCWEFLKPGGYLRAAVPDGCHPDPAYIDGVRPGGSGAGADDHRVLYTAESFAAVFRAAGFEVCLLEYFDAAGMFHFAEWSPAQGPIERSRRFDPRNAGGTLAYTSIVLDAVKPLR